MQIAKENAKRAKAKSRGYVPQKPTPKQKEFLDCTALDCFFGGAAGGGKMLPLNEAVPTPSGWTTIGALREGDFIFSARGFPVRVAELYAVETPDESWRIHFDDGTFVNSCAEHKWLTFSASELLRLTKSTEEYRARRRATRPSRATGNRGALVTQMLTERNKLTATSKEPPRGTVRTTRDIVHGTKPGKRSAFAMPVSSPIDLPEASLPLDPYLLGVWLGDGTSSGSGITTADESIMQSFVDAGFELGIRQKKASSNKAWTQSVKGLCGPLRAAGVFNNKHIPQQYLRASIQQRTELLRGLLDTDGTVTDGGSVEFTSTKHRLAETAHELILSLGYKCRKVEGRATLRGVDIGPKWDMKFTAREILFRLERKAKKQRIASRRTTRFRYVVRVERVPPVAMRCIRVDAADGLFLVGRSFLVTHNSSAMLMAALQYVHVPGYTALIIRRTFSALSKPGALLDRAKNWLDPTDAKWKNETHRWTFPNGASLTFGHCDHAGDLDQYQGGEFDFIGVEEVTQFPEVWVRYLFSRIRRTLTNIVPPRFRATGNPGGIGHMWVYQRYVDPQTKRGVFIPSKLSDNPHLNADEYRLALAELDETTRKQLEEGDWTNVGNGMVYATAKLIYELPAKRFDVYGLGLDYASENDKCSYNVVGYNYDSPVVTAVRSYKKDHSASQSAEEAEKLIAEFKPRFIIGDANGLGKGYVKEARRRFNIPVEPADKENKAGYIKLQNGAAEAGEFVIFEPGCKELIAERKVLPWSDASREEYPEGFEDDCSDGTLYIWRKCMAFRAKHKRFAPGGVRPGYTNQ